MLTTITIIAILSVLTTWLINRKYSPLKTFFVGFACCLGAMVLAEILASGGESNGEMDLLSGIFYFVVTPLFYGWLGYLGSKYEV